MLTTEWGTVRYPSCRDKGRMWGRVGAWCLSWWQRDPLGTSWSTKVAPQPGQAPGPLIHPTPPLVPTGPWAASRCIGPLGGCVGIPVKKHQDALVCHAAGRYPVQFAGIQVSRGALHV